MALNRLNLNVTPFKPLAVPPPPPIPRWFRTVSYLTLSMSSAEPREKATTDAYIAICERVPKTILTAKLCPPVMRLWMDLHFCSPSFSPTCF